MRGNTDEWRRGYGEYGVSGRGPTPETGWARDGLPAHESDPGTYGPQPGEYGYRGQRRHATDGWRGEGEWGYLGGPIRGTEEWHGDRPRDATAESWSVPGPHTGRGPRDYRRSETAIREDVCERLTRHGYVDASTISVRVESSEVVLEGDVESRAAKRMAEDAAESVSGVRDVHNRLRIRPHSGDAGSGNGLAAEQRGESRDRGDQRG